MIDYEKQIKKAKLLITELELDYIIICGKGNVRYFTGYEPLLGDVMFFLTKEGDKRLLNRFEWDRSSIPVIFKENEIISSYDFALELLELIKNRNCNIGIAGLEYLPYKVYCSIVSVCNNIIKLDKDIANLRIMKSEAEIALIRRAVEITEESIQNVSAAMKVGVTEAEIGAMFEYEVKRRNAPELAFGSSVAFGQNSSQIAWIPSSKKLMENEAIFFDVGARYNGYCADIGRTFFCGKPTKEYLDIYNRMLEIQNVLIDFIKPGMHAKEPYLKVEELFVRNGLGSPRHRLGHGVGIETSMEGPDLKYGDTILKPNMAFAIEISHAGTAEGGIKIEDNVILREYGCELLSTSSKELKLL